MKSISRRGFIKSAAVVTACHSIPKGKLLAAKKRAQLIVVHGTDIPKMLEVGINNLGGWGSLIKSGAKVTIKPNVAWISRPEQGGNTDPVLVGECVRACKGAGAGKVILPENTVADAAKTFEISGIARAVKNAGGELHSLKEKTQYRKVEIPAGKVLKEADVAIDVLDTDLLINMPVAKSHRAALLTVSMKNLMGSVFDRKIMHANGLDQSIADLSTVIHPKLVIVDATRIMTTGGPRGPGNVIKPNQLIFSSDMVAADAYAATLFEKKPFEIPHIRIAHEMGIGCGKLEDVQIKHLNV